MLKPRKVLTARGEGFEPCHREGSSGARWETAQGGFPGAVRECWWPLQETPGWMELLHVTQQTANGNDMCALPAWLSQAGGTGCKVYCGEWGGFLPLYIKCHEVTWGCIFAADAWLIHSQYKSLFSNLLAYGSYLFFLSFLLPACGNFCTPGCHQSKCRRVTTITAGTPVSTTVTPTTPDTARHPLGPRHLDRITANVTSVHGIALILPMFALVVTLHFLNIQIHSVAFH